MIQSNEQVWHRTARVISELGLRERVVIEGKHGVPTADDAVVWCDQHHITHLIRVGLVQGLDAQEHPAQHNNHDAVIFDGKPDARNGRHYCTWSNGWT